MGLFGRARGPTAADLVRGQVPLAAGERLLAMATDETSGGHVVATTHHLALVDAAGILAWRHPWHEVESATWQRDSFLLTVLWVGHRRPAQWLVREPSRLQETLRERVQASVVLADEFLTQSRRRVRVVIRQDLATGALLEQTIPGRGADLSDPDVAREAADRLARLRSEVGL
ncbi:MAG TPA: hypothetical protein VFJ94_03685 [Intrasporangium sp.]|uniref:hypothetical protein n=1 Tax=Intrasporangium sp. TaxID=1925024 RepID=UPI002D79C032|nr:hypothetical protein [Intrasporangium sp.]HET7397604.1 hypothetical protein [Intrasporangium sp.]